jgi:hypothetical protein
MVTVGVALRPFGCAAMAPPKPPPRASPSAWLPVKVQWAIVPWLPPVTPTAPPLVLPPVAWLPVNVECSMSRIAS